MILIGTAGWVVPTHYRTLQDRERSHLYLYSRCFNAVEINSSFQRWHRQETYMRWAAETPAEFRFSVKLPRTLTHEHALRRCRRELETFVAAVQGLGAKLSVVLTQLPPSLEFEPRVARTFFRQLAALTPATIVCEARHPSWFSSRAGETLGASEVHRAIADPPVVAGETGTPLPDGFVYCRLHGSPRMYYSAYSEERLAELGLQLQKFRWRGRGWCIFDNTASGSAWPNGRLLRSQLARAKRNSPTRARRR
jgi:uncharacterized protein YecE (DUF72 family)